MAFFARASSLSGRIAASVSRNQTLLQAIVGILAFALGLWGWNIKDPPEALAEWFNNFFRTLQLITLQFPSELDTDIPWQLNVARLAVPTVAALATFHVILGTITRPVRLALLSRTRDHIVLVGSSRLSEAALKSLAERSEPIIVVEKDVETARRETLEGWGVTLVEADPAQPATFESLNLKQAKAVFLTTDSDAQNLDLAMQVLQITLERRNGGAPLRLGVMAESEEFAVELDAALDGLSRQANVSYHRLCPDRDTLRLELETLAPAFLKQDRQARSHTLVFGLAGAWTQIIMQLVIAMQDHPENRALLTLVIDEESVEKVTAWITQKPDLALVAEFVFLKTDRKDLDLAAIDAWRQKYEAPQLVVVLKDEESAVTFALSLRRPEGAFGVGDAPILVWRRQEDRLLPRLAQSGVRNRDLTRIVPFGGLVRTEAVARILDSKREDLAMRLHASYVGNVAAKGWEARSFVDAWELLPENARNANRASAWHAPILFAGVDRKDLQEEAMSDPEMLDRLARIEHRRWICDRIDNGWRHGVVRNDAARLHPNIVGYETLSKEDRDKDMESVRLLASLSGFRTGDTSGGEKRR